MSERNRRRLGVGGRVLLLLLLSVSSVALASEYHGQVSFGGLPVPGSTVTVTATQGTKTAVAVTDSQGVFSFADLADGRWTLEIAMTGFAPIKQEVTVAPNAAAGLFEMKLLSLDEIRAQAKPVIVEAAVATTANAAAAEATTQANATPTATAAPSATSKKKKATAQEASAAAPNAATAAAAPDANTEQASDGLVINGSVNNAATSQYSQSSAYGNTRNGRSLYTGGLSLVLENSALDAQPYSLTGEQTPPPSFNNFTAGVSFGGPLNIKHLMPRGPYFDINYQRTQNSTVTSQQALVPTEAQRAGNLAGTTIINPATGSAISGSVPITAQAQALLNYYPHALPELAGNSIYNYQTSLTNDTHADASQFRLRKQFGNKNYLYGSTAIQSTRSSNESIFNFGDSNFVDSTAALNISGSANWNYRFTQRMWMNVGYSFGRSRTQATPFFANRVNVEGAAMIVNPTNLTSSNWGPPSLGFSSGIAGLSDGHSSYNRNETNSVSYTVEWYHLRHDIKVGGDFRRLENNYLQQSNAPGSLGFTGAASGSDFADFLLGVPDTSNIAYGNADKYFRQSRSDAYFTDDFRVNSQFTLNYGLRWEYGSPISELKGRLVNLDIAPGFTNEAPVLASAPYGSVTGQTYPRSLVHPDHSRPEPRVSIAWRPISGSSLRINSGYAITNDTSVYQAVAMAMSQQQGPTSPLLPQLSTSLNITGSPTCQISLANPFQTLPCSTTVPDSFAIDPNFRVAYVQTWNLAAQRDLPGSLLMIATYTGIKGTRGVQEILPNTVAYGGTKPSSAPSGYAYRTSNGNSTRESGSIELRRRLRSGFTADATYTFSKSLDDDYSLGAQGSVNKGSGIAQDWTNPSGQRGLSTIDQRHVLNLTAQYTTGMGLGGHTLMSGWRGLAYKEWTISTRIKVASGLPETPIVPVTIVGATYSGIIRGNYVGGPIHLKSPGRFLNPAAFVAPQPGQWGTARRDSITGPNQFTMDASMQRDFRLPGRYSLSAEADASNILNHVAFSSWNTSVGTSQFGAATGPNSMRTMSITMRLRF